MSAYIVSRGTIRFLVEAGFRLKDGGGSSNPLRWRRPVEGGDPILCRMESRNDADAAGAMLWEENRKSVAYRYPDDKQGEWPGGIEEGPNVGEVYRHVSTPDYAIGRPTPAQVFAIIDCYEYQSSEHPEWERSEARDYCDALRRRYCRMLATEDWGAPDIWETTDLKAWREAAKADAEAGKAVRS